MGFDRNGVHKYSLDSPWRKANAELLWRATGVREFGDDIDPLIACYKYTEQKISRERERMAEEQHHTASH